MTSVFNAIVDASGVAAVGLLGIIARVLWKAGRGWSQMLEDWRGTPARPGVQRVPGVLERLSFVEDGVAEIRHEVKPNSGVSMRDDLSRIHQATTGQPAPGDSP
jgi:hypothetical protein